MFTGIVTEVGEVIEVIERAESLRQLRIVSGYDHASIAIGASVSCAGVCLTVVATGAAGDRGAFVVDAAAETLAVTTARQWRQGTKLNLERALRLGDELGGHIVSGHVDGLAEVTAREDLPDMVRFFFKAPQPLARFIASKGSVALDGVSLTVNEVLDDVFSVLVIPHTLAVTTIAGNHPGDRLNLEVDLMARYAARLMEFR
jgi:riboflavin synthase